MPALTHVHKSLLYLNAIEGFHLTYIEAIQCRAAYVVLA